MHYTLHLPPFHTHTHAQSNLFPERETVFDFYFQCTGGQWTNWEDMIDRTAGIPAKARVRGN